MTHNLCCCSLSQNTIYYNSSLPNQDVPGFVSYQKRSPTPLKGGRRMRGERSAAIAADKGGYPSSCFSVLQNSTLVGGGARRAPPRQQQQQQQQHKKYHNWSHSIIKTHPAFSSVVAKCTTVVPNSGAEETGKIARFVRKTLNSAMSGSRCQRHRPPSGARCVL